MNSLRSRLRRHLSFANVMASIAVFLALGGVGYAATSINGGKLIKESVGAGKLKKGTLTSKQVKANSLNGGVIDESSLTIVPSAQVATSATSAATATSATSAATATSATTAQSAARADSANSAATANHALTADSATRATLATSAESADSADDAETLDGLSAKQLQVACPADTELFGGMCWDEDVRPLKNWIGASKECGDAGGRLPSLSELVAFVLRPGEQVTAQNWSADVIDVAGIDKTIATNDETTTLTALAAGGSLGFRCLFYRVN